jgi:hypothetical protein
VLIAFKALSLSIYSPLLRVKRSWPPVVHATKKRPTVAKGSHIWCSIVMHLPMDKY